MSSGVRFTGIRIPQGIGYGTPPDIDSPLQQRSPVYAMTMQKHGGSQQAPVEPRVVDIDPTKGRLTLPQHANYNWPGGEPPTAA